MNQGQGEGRREARRGRNPWKGKLSASPRVGERSLSSQNGPSLSPPRCGSTAHALTCDFRNMLLILRIFFLTALRHLSPPWLEALRDQARQSLADPQHSLTDDQANAPARLSVLNSSLLPVGSCSACTLGQRRHGIKDGEGCSSPLVHTEPHLVPAEPAVGISSLLPQNILISEPDAASLSATALRRCSCCTSLQRRMGDKKESVKHHPAKNLQPSAGKDEAQSLPHHLHHLCSCGRIPRVPQSPVPSQRAAGD